MDNREILEITVTKRTAEGLRDVAKETGLTIGEIVDKLATEIDSTDPEMAPTDPKTATIFALQEAFAILSHLDYEDYQKAYFDLTAAIMAYYPPKAFSELAAEAKLQRKKAIAEKEMADLTEEEIQSLLDLLKKFRRKNTRK